MAKIEVTIEDVLTLSLAAIDAKTFFKGTQQAEALEELLKRTAEAVKAEEEQNKRK